MDLFLGGGGGGFFFMGKVFYYGFFLCIAEVRMEVYVRRGGFNY